MKDSEQIRSGGNVKSGQKVAKQNFGKTDVRYWHGAIFKPGWSRNGKTLMSEKGNASKKEAIDRASGSGVFARHADGIITLTKHKTDQAYSVEAELRSFKRMQPFVVKFEYPLMRVAEDLDPADLKDRAGAPKKHDVPKLLECLTDGMTSGQWKAAALLQGIKSSTFYELRTVAVVSDRVMETEDKIWVRKPKVTVFNPMSGEVEVRDAGTKVAA